MTAESLVRLARAHKLVAEPLYFLFYMNGKSAVRVGTRSLMCGGVHGWQSAAAPRHKWRTNLPSLAQRERITLDASAASQPQHRATILHYACCSLSNFAAKDWPALGYLEKSGRFLKGASDGATPHIERWHAIQGGGGGAGASAPSRRLREDFLALIALHDEKEIARQRSAGILVSFDGPSTLLLLGR